VTVDRIWKSSDGTLTDLLGTPASALPGLDNPALSGTVGKYGVTHETTAIVIKGTYTSVRAITGTGKELGVVAPEITAGDPVPFLLAIPQGEDITKLPVLVFGHGAGGLLPEVLGLADLAGHAHAAVIAHETYLHGERSLAASDTEHTLRGDGGALGPDGFAEHQATEVSLRLFAFDGTPADQRCSPLYLQGSIVQMAADVHALLAMIATSNLAPIAAADPSLAGLAFDKDRIFFLGISLGTLYGSLMLAGDTRIAAAALDVPVPSVSESLVENDVFRAQLELLMLAPWDIPNDTYEPERHLLMNPLLAMHEWTLAPIAPISLARHNATRPGRDLLIQIAGLDEAAGTPGGEGMVAAAGVPAVGDFAYATVIPGTAPIQGSGAWLFPQADHAMIGHQKGASKFEPPALPPFVPRATPLLFDDPIQGVHDQLVHFFDTRRVKGVGEIR
jgi:hypothetical protein